MVRLASPDPDAPPSTEVEANSAEVEAEPTEAEAKPAESEAEVESK